MQVNGSPHPGMYPRAKTKRLKFNLEVGSSVIDDSYNKQRGSALDGSVEWVSGLKNQVLMFNSLNDFKTDIKKMQKLNSTVRNVAGFRYAPHVNAATKDINEMA